jgi:hypothetical protein
MAKIQTTCKDCVFRVRTITGVDSCTHDRINKFKEIGVKIEVEDGFNVIDRGCNLIRNEDWALAHTGTVDLKTIARSEVVKRSTIFIQFSSNNSIDDIENIMGQLRNQKLKPDNIVIYYGDNEKATSSVAIIKLLREKFSDVNWKLEIPMSNNGMIRDEWHKFIDKYNTSHYFILLFASDNIDENLCSDIDKAVNDDLLKVGLVVDNDFNMFAVSSDFFFSLSGDSPIKLPYQEIDEQGNVVDKVSELEVCNIEQKILFLQSKDLSNNKYVYNLGEICQKQALLL